MKSKRLFSKAVILIVSVCILLPMVPWGCSESTSTTTTTGAKPPAASGPQYGGVLKIGYPTHPLVVGYPPDARWRTDDNIVGKAVIETLARVDGEGKENPWLAESWQADPKALTLTVKLKRGIKFHDGSDFNAEAVKWNWEQWTANKKPEVKFLKSVDIIDDYTVRANLSAWDSESVYNIIVYAGAIISPTAFKLNGKAWSEKNPVGTGCFQFVSQKTDVNLIYKKFDGYWQKGKPYLDGMEFIMIKEATTLQASFIAGELDIALGLGKKETKDLEKMGKYIMLIPKNAMGSSISLIGGDGNTADSPFANVKVRQAVGHAINRQAISNAINMGYGSLTDQWVPKGHPYYNTNVKGTPYNPEKAKSLLVEAGYPNGFKTTLFSMDSAEARNTNEAIQADLAKVGIDAKLEILANPKRMDLMFNGWRNGLFSSGPKTAPGTIASFEKFLGSKGDTTVSWYRNQKIDNLIDQARNAITSDLQKQALSKLWEAAFDEFCSVTPLWILDRLGAKYGKVNNDGFYSGETSESTPEDAWIKR